MVEIGKLFVFEGVDGSGKTTLSRAFAEHAKAIGFECDWFPFPGRESGTVGKHVYDIHHDRLGVRIATINPTSLQLLHIAAHIDAINRRILPALKQGRLVVLDRYWWSTFVYGTVAGADQRSLKRMIQIELLHWRKIRPTCAFWVRRKAPLGENLSLEQTSLAKEYDKFSNLQPAKPTVVYESYWRFAAERQAIFFRKLSGEPPPWTNDTVLREHKFTNAYRASDRTSQYLIREVIYSGDQTLEEVFFRIMLFKLFNRIQTWELLTRAFGSIRYQEYSFARYDSVLTQAMISGEPIYSGAYIMPSGRPSSDNERKHRMHLRLIEQMLKDDLPARISEAASMGKAFEMLRAYATIGDFLAYQFVTDLNYSTLLNFSEMEFVVPGPGARDGIRKCFSDFGGLTETDIIKLVAERQQNEFECLGLEFKSLWGRPLQLIDCQNLFCEVDKYSRVKHPEITGRTGRTRIKQKYRITAEPISFWYPPKWDLNDRIAKGGPLVSSL